MSNERGETTGKRVGALALWATLPVACSVLVDLALGGLAGLSTPTRCGLFGVSLLYAFLCWALAIELCTRAWRAGRGALALTLVILLGGGEALLAVGSHAHKQYFGALPNVYAFTYLYDEPREFIASLAGGLTFRVVLGVALFALAVTAYLFWTSKRQALLVPVRSAVRRTAAPVLVIALLGAATYALQNNVRIYPDSLLPEVHTAAAAVRASCERLSSGHRALRTLSPGTRPRLPAAKEPLPFHILVLLNESVGRGHVSLYGYARETTPEQSRFLRERAAQTVLFRRGYANASRTAVSFPSLLTGVSPAEPVARMHRAPLVFDYFAAFANAHVFSITSQSWRPHNIDDFVGKTGMATRFTRESRPELSCVNDIALDDAHAVDALEQMLEALPADKRMAGLLQFYGTHFAYYSEQQDQKWGAEEWRDRYDAAIHRTDALIVRAMRALERRGLLDDTLVIATSDHGDAFGEHGYDGHLQTAYEEEVAIPLWVHLPRALLADTELVARLRANAELPVSNLDLVPTLVDTLWPAGPPPEVRLGDFAGSSWSRALPAERPIIMMNAAQMNSNQLAAGAGVLLWPYKLILLTRGGPYERLLYDLSKDPAERENVWGAGSSNLVSRARELFLAYDSTKPLARELE